LGYVQALAAVIGALALAQSLEGDSVADVASTLAFLGFGLWYLVASLVLIIAWSRRNNTTKER
jgi:hypothetical protein